MQDREQPQPYKTLSYSDRSADQKRRG
jgi:hypothetical protein